MLTAAMWLCKCNIINVALYWYTKMSPLSDSSNLIRFSQLSSFHYFILSMITSLGTNSVLTLIHKTLLHVFRISVENVFDQNAPCIYLPREYPWMSKIFSRVQQQQQLQHLDNLCTCLRGIHNNAINTNIKLPDKWPNQ